MHLRGDLEGEGGRQEQEEVIQQLVYPYDWMHAKLKIPP